MLMLRLHAVGGGGKKNKSSVARVHVFTCGERGGERRKKNYLKSAL